jgi:hypothetical protein
MPELSLSRATDFPDNGLYSPLSRRTFLKRSAVLLGAMGLGPMRLNSVRADDTAKSSMSVTDYLFIDDQFVECVRGATRKLHQPKKAGLIQEEDGSPWQCGDQRSVVRDLRGRFHMTYRFMWPDPSVRSLDPRITEDKYTWIRSTIGYAVSDDGIRWTKPVLNLVDGPTGFRPTPEVEWRDGFFLQPSGFSRSNNLGCPIARIMDLGSFHGIRDKNHRYFVNVQRHDSTLPFAGLLETGSYYSADVPNVAGNPKWRQELVPIGEGSGSGPRVKGDARVSGFDEHEQIWFMCTQSKLAGWASRDGRDIGRWTSRDLITWGPEELVLPVAQDESRTLNDHIEYYALDVMRVADMWLGRLVIFHTDRSNLQFKGVKPEVWQKGTTELRLVASRDAGKNWRRICNKEVWLPHHEAENGYDRMVYLNSPVRVGDELWLYYSCFDGDHLTWNRDGTPFYKNRARIGRTARATLRWNGFVSFNAGQKAELLTKPLLATSGNMFVNAAASKGSIRVELRDTEDRPIEGFRLADCIPLINDGIHQPVIWRDKPHLPERFRDRPLRLYFEFDQSDFYGFSISEATA